MKLLLDENLPHDLRHYLPGHDVFTVTYAGFSGLKNGVLLSTAAAAGFEALITLDAGIEFEQNLALLPCAVVILHARSNGIADLEPVIVPLLDALRSLRPRTLVHVKDETP